MRFCLISTTKKKRKLCPSLSEFCEKLIAVDIKELRGQDCSEDDIITLLVAKFGFNMVNKAIQVYNRMPQTLTPHQKRTYLSVTPVIMDIIELAEELCPTLLHDSSQLDADQELIFAPPVKECLQCDSNLTGNYSSAVKAYSLSKVVNSHKFTLRCKSCSLIYNYATFDKKTRDGFKYYDEYVQDFIEVNDAVYFERNLVELYCCLA